MLYALVGSSCTGLATHNKAVTQLLETVGSRTNIGPSLYTSMCELPVTHGYNWGLTFRPNKSSGPTIFISWKLCTSEGIFDIQH